MRHSLLFNFSHIIAITENSFLLKVGREQVKIPFSDIPNDHPAMLCERIAALVKHRQ